MNEYNEDFRLEDGILHVRLSGKLPNKLFGTGENVFQPLINACSTYNCKKALIDARDLRADFNVAALFQAGEDVALATHGGLRIALLAREDMRDPFFDDVVYLKGGDVGVFTDMNTAIAWLQR